MRFKCLKKFHQRLILLFGLVFCSCLLVLSGCLSESVSAVGVTYGNVQWNARQAGSSWLGYTLAGENRLVPAGTALDMLQFYTGGSTTYYQQFTAGKYYIFTSSFVFRFDYAGDQVVNPLPTFNCPILNTAGFSSISCDVATTVDVAATQHFITYVWTNVVRADVTYNNVNNLNFSFYMKNKSTLPGQLYVSGLTIGDSSQEPTTSAIQSLNSDLSARIQSLLDATNAFKGAFESWGVGIDRQLTAILNAIGSSGVTQQGIENAINNSIEEQKQQSEQDFQDTQDDAQDSADDSADEAESSGSTLLGAFTSFLGALTNQSATTCVINADIGRFRMGNVDLCELDPPPAFQAISSIMVIGFTIPLSLALGRKMISLFRSFQR